MQKSWCCHWQSRVLRVKASLSSQNTQKVEKERQREKERERDSERERRRERKTESEREGRKRKRGRERKRKRKTERDSWEREEKTFLNRTPHNNMYIFSTDPTQQMANSYDTITTKRPGRWRSPHPHPPPPQKKKERKEQPLFISWFRFHSGFSSHGDWTMV